MQLCTYSRSAILLDAILPECPLGLNQSAAATCQCRKRLYHVPPFDLRVLSCTYPNNWQGRPLVLSKGTVDMSERKPLFGLVGGKELVIPVIGFSGGYGSGKTLAGLTLSPSETTEIGLEDSGVTYHLPLAKRYSMYSEVRAKAKDGIPTPMECFEWFQDILPKIDTRILFIDPITDIQQGMVDWVEAHPEKFGKTRAQYEKASGLLWGDVKSFVKILLGRMSKKVECLIFTAHMGTVWKDGKPVAGKEKAKGLDVFRELASLYVHLSRPVDPASGKQPAAPIGHTCLPHGKSRLAHTVVRPDGVVEVQAILPPRVEPFTWEKLREYVAKPPDFAKLKKSELAQIDHMTAEDRLLLESEIAANNLETERIRLEIKERAEDSRKEIESKNARRETEKISESTSTEKPVEKPKEDKKPDPPKQEAPKEEAKPAQSQTDPEKPVKLDREQLLATIRDQFQQLEATSEVQSNAIKKRGGKVLEDLNDDQLEDLRRSCWSTLTKRGLAKK